MPVLKELDPTKIRKKRSGKSLRNEIRERLLQIDDIGFLEAMLVFVQTRQDVPIKLSPVMLQAIDDAERDDAEGKLCSHEDVMKEVRQWLAENP